MRIVNDNKNMGVTQGYAANRFQHSLAATLETNIQLYGGISYSYRGGYLLVTTTDELTKWHQGQSFDNQYVEEQANAVMHRLSKEDVGLGQ